jgi:serine/threonine-protein kinase RsbW
MTSYVVPHTPRSAATIRHRLVVDLMTRQVPPRVVDDAALVISELVGNAVRHGAPLRDGGVRVAWEIADCALRLEVHDGGCGPDGHAPHAPAASAESGRGLAIVEMLAERWGTTASGDGGSAVYADLPLGVAVAQNAARRAAKA